MTLVSFSLIKVNVFIYNYICNERGNHIFELPLPSTDLVTQHSFSYSYRSTHAFYITVRILKQFWNVSLDPEILSDFQLNCLFTKSQTT